MSDRRIVWHNRGNIDLTEASSSKMDAKSASISSKSKRRIEEEEDDAAETAEYLRRKHKFIKSSIRTDYQPDICKDYKETGFCGFGDSCKFLHDRSDYKHGWQLDREWAKGEYADEADDKYLIKDGDSDEDDGIPLECPICRESYKDPVVTKCQHYFCSRCAEKECSDKCFTCEKPTSGIFKNASKVINERSARVPTQIDATKSDSNDEEDEPDSCQPPKAESSTPDDAKVQMVDKNQLKSEYENSDSEEITRNDDNEDNKSENEYDHYEW